MYCFLPRYFARDCEDTFGLAEEARVKEEGESGAACTSKYSGAFPCTRGEVRVVYCEVSDCTYLSSSYLLTHKAETYTTSECLTPVFKLSLSSLWLLRLLRAQTHNLWTQVKATPSWTLWLQGSWRTGHRGLNRTELRQISKWPVRNNLSNNLNASQR